MASYAAQPVIHAGTFIKGPREAALGPDLQSEGFGLATRDWGFRQYTSSWQNQVEQAAPLLDADTGERSEAGLRNLFAGLGQAVARHGETYAGTDPREFAEAVRPPMPEQLVEVAIGAYNSVFEQQGDQV